jgi:Protein of unknown function (DUF1761)
MPFNIIAVLVAAIVPLLVGFLWYNPKMFGNAWMKAAGVTEESMKGANMALIFGLTFLFSFMAAIALAPIVVHQMGVFSVFMNDPAVNDPNSEISLYLKDFMDKYGNNFRTFKHGALHGFITGLFIGFPIMAVNGLFERKSWKYIWINTGFWATCFLIMGGIICAWQ